MHVTIDTHLQEIMRLKHAASMLIKCHHIVYLESLPYTNLATLL